MFCQLQLSNCVLVCLILLFKLIRLCKSARKIAQYLHWSTPSEWCVWVPRMAAPIISVGCRLMNLKCTVVRVRTVSLIICWLLQRNPSSILPWHWVCSNSPVSCCVLQCYNTRRRFFYCGQHTSWQSEECHYMPLAVYEWHSFCRHSIVCKRHYRNICFLNFCFFYLI